MRAEKKHSGWEFVSVVLVLILVGSWAYFFWPGSEKASHQNGRQETFIEKEKAYQEPGEEIISLNRRYECPDDMVVIPGHETGWVWVLSEDGKHRRIKGKSRKIKTFCMDRYEYPNKKNLLPLTRVSYLVANRMCEEQGKRLCSEFEWELACMGPEGSEYAYGPDREAWRCNTDGVPVGAEGFIAPSGSHPGCRNKYGVYDLNGNVSEWVAMRERGNLGVVRGGTAWASSEYGQSCFSRHAHPVTDSHWPDDGFRCCKNAAARNRG